jgi:hypothetical protein
MNLSHGGCAPSMGVQVKPAAISAAPGGGFSLFGGYVIGRQLELTPQADRAGVASGQLASGRLFDRDIYAGRISRRD